MQGEDGTMATVEEEVETFLRAYGPAAKKLSLAHILPVIGFRHAKGEVMRVSVWGWNWEWSCSQGEHVRFGSVAWHAG